MKSLIFRALSFCVCVALFLVLTSCSHDDDPTPYEPIPWGGAKEVVLAIDGVTVDSAFCANSSVYCEEDGKTVAISLCNGDSVSFLLPSPNVLVKRELSQTRFALPSVKNEGRSPTHATSV